MHHAGLSVIDKMLCAAMFTIPMLLFWFSDGPVDENLAEVCEIFGLETHANI